MLDAGTHAERPALAGVRVVDWTHVLAGPYAGYLLGQMGADVIRVERADGGDITRTTALDERLGALELGEGFVMQGSGKRSIAIDARDAEARAALLALIAGADVLIENFRPGKLGALGLDPAALIERFPRLVVCSVTGFGQSGELSGRRAYDHVIQAASGIMAANRDEAGRPQRIGLPLIDYATGMQAALAVVAALHRRAQDAVAGVPRTRGEWLDVSMHEVALTISAPAYASHAVSGIERKASRATAFSGNPLSGTFDTAAGHLAIVCNTDAQSRAFVSAMRAAGEVATEVDALQAAVAQRDVEATHHWIAARLATRSAADWEAHFRAFEVPAAEVVSPAAAYDRAKGDAARWPRVRLDRADGRIVAVPGPGYGSTAPHPSTLAPPPLRGEHGRALLREVGVDDAAFDAMRARGAVYEPGSVAP
ncbi:MAG: CaiB/BaiF CoA transferase family protein [Lautropia sp.]